MFIFKSEKKDKEHAIAFLCSLIALLVVSSLVDANSQQSSLVSVLWAVVILLAVVQRTDSFLVTGFASIIALIWFIFEFSPVPVNDAVHTLFPASLLLLTVYVLLHRIFTCESVNISVLISAMSVYFLLGICWALIYTMAFQLSPESFVFPAAHSDQVFVNMVYFSFTTITTLGYGDILPVSPTMRIFSSLEAVSGVLYPAILIARLISLYKKEE